MRLIKCHVENFGTLSDFDVNFEKGLTVIKEDNGFGKSTLAVFIKAMFYGLLQSTKRNLSENERKKYTPWQGGAFGGSLDFEVGRKQYRIERFFAAKEKDDTFKLYDLDTNSLSRDYSENIGLKLFGIDSESFERSVYVPQTDMGTAMNNSIRAKLTGLVENSDDISNFDNAKKALDKRAKEYSVANGARGAISEKTAAIEQLEAMRNDAVAASQNLEAVSKELAVLSAERQRIIEALKKIREQITAASDSAARAEQAKRRNELIGEIEGLVAKKNGILKRYPNGCPAEDLLTEAEQTVRLKDETAAALEVLSSDTADRDELTRLEVFFNGQIPSKQETADCKALLEQTVKQKVALEGLEARISAVSAQPSSETRSVKPLLLAAAVLAVAGGVSMVWALGVGIVLLALGLVTFGIAGFVYLKGMISATGRSNAEDPVALQSKYDELFKDISSAQQTVGEFTHRYMPSENLGDALEVISQSLRDLERLQNVVSEQERRLESRKQRITECNAVLEAFFKDYGVGLQGMYRERLATVRNDLRELETVDGRLVEFKKKLSEIPIPTESVDENASADKDELLAEEKRLSISLSSTEQEISRLNAFVSRLSAQAEGLSELEEQIESLREERDEMQYKFNIINTTLLLLQKAKEGLSMRYLDRMTEGFKKYSNIISGEQSGDSLIDTDLDIKLSQKGSARDKEYFSQGIRDMIDIAMRLSLADALYENERPMLILDDPFVNLDDRRLKNAMELLKKLADERQIVYLTCHSSRC